MHRSGLRAAAAAIALAATPAAGAATSVDEMGTVRQFVARCDRSARDFDWCKSTIIVVAASHGSDLCSDLIAITGSRAEDDQKAETLTRKVVALLRSNPAYGDDDAGETVLIALMALSGCH